MTVLIRIAGIACICAFRMRLIDTDQLQTRRKFVALLAMATERFQRLTVLSSSTFAFTICFAVWTMFGEIGVPIAEELGAARDLRTARSIPMTSADALQTRKQDQ